jgi:hypothetical protein
MCGEHVQKFFAAASDAIGHLGSETCLVAMVLAIIRCIHVLGLPVSSGSFLLFFSNNSC